MRSAVMRMGRVGMRDDVAEPVPAMGQVLVQVKACGICGSDLHFVKHGADMVRLFARMEGVPALGYGPPDVSRDVFMGHEFAGEVIGAGPDTQAPPPGTLVTSIPVMLSGGLVRDLSYNNDFPGGYSERMLLCAPFVLTVPNGLDAERAALTEPMAVGSHAVNRSSIDAHQGALVIGCGPIGLAIVAALGLRGIEPIVASDFSRDRRRLATAIGAHREVDPAEESPFDAWRAESRGKGLVVFEAVGVPGVIDEVMRRAPMQSSLVVAGVCMQPDSLTPFYAIAKEMRVQFVLAYTPDEFSSSLRDIAEGRIDVGPLITGRVGIDAVAEAFEDLANPEGHCKILVTP